MKKVTIYDDHDAYLQGVGGVTFEFFDDDEVSYDDIEDLWHLAVMQGKTIIFYEED